MRRAFSGVPGSHARPYDEWERLVLDGGYRVLCAVEDDRLLAAATHADRLGDGYVGQLAVDENARGRGLARGLLQTCFALDAAAGRPRTTLSVDGENDTARRLYDGLGMDVAQEFRRWERDLTAS